MSRKILSVLLASDNQVKYKNNKMEISMLEKILFSLKVRYILLKGELAQMVERLALHVRGTGIDTRILHFFYSTLRAWNYNLYFIDRANIFLFLYVSFPYMCPFEKIQKEYMQIFMLKHIKYENSFGYCCSTLLMASNMSC